MEQKKNTLYILHYTRSEYGEMVLFYAQDEGEAWIKAAEWANSINFIIPKGAEYDPSYFASTFRPKRSKFYKV